MMTRKDFLRWLDEYFMTYVVPGFSLGIAAAILVGTVVGVEGSYGRFLWVDHWPPRPDGFVPRGRWGVWRRHHRLPPG